VTTAVERIAGEEYTWATATNVAWDSPEHEGSEFGSFAINLWQLTCSTPLSVLDSVFKGKLFFKNFAESLGLIDSSKKSVHLPFARNLHLCESYTDLIDFNLRFVESLAIADRTRFATSLELVDEFSVASSHAKTAQFYREFSSAFGLSDALANAFGLSRTEYLVVEPTHRKQGAKSISQALSVIDQAPIKNVTKHSIQPFVISDFKAHVWDAYLAFETQLALESVDSRQATVSTFEYFDITHESDWREITRNSITPLLISEAWGRTAKYNRDLIEGLGIADPISFAVEHRIYEFARIYAGLERAGDLAVSDMILSNGDLSLDAFKQMIEYGRPAGYSNWRDFMPGDYEYQKAMFRAVLSSKNSDRGMLTNIQAVVDVPDIIDRGSATIEVAANGVRVNFNREFHIIPEVVLTTKGGVGVPATPDVVDIDLLGFTAIMRTPDGALSSGVFAWAAHGY